MAAFDRIPSGIPEMDKVLDNIRLGDNVVWRVSNLDVFKAFVNPYVRQAVKDGRHVVYVRFAAHDSLIDDLTGVEVVQVELSHRFETFTVDIHNIIEQRARTCFMSSIASQSCRPPGRRI
jgi:pyruvate,water dikinase